MGLNTMMMNLEYYNRFPITLKSALLSGRVKFPDSLQREYNDLCVYRGVKYTAEKTVIDRTDFLSNVERKKESPLVVADDSKISSYSCSCFLNIDEMRIQAKFPRKSKAIAKGVIKSEFGPIDINEDTSHVDLYLFDNVDPSSGFEVVEKWEKNG